MLRSCPLPGLVFPPCLLIRRRRFRWSRGRIDPRLSYRPNTASPRHRDLLVPWFAAKFLGLSPGSCSWQSGSDRSSQRQKPRFPDLRCEGRRQNWRVVEWRKPTAARMRHTAG